MKTNYFPKAIIAPVTAGGLPVDFSKGFDVLNRRGTVVKHFEEYAPAELMRRSDPNKYQLRFWAIVDKEGEE